MNLALLTLEAEKLMSMRKTSCRERNSGYPMVDDYRVGNPGFGLGIMLVHYLGPPSWHWLTPEQLDKVESLFSGSGITYITVTLTRRLTL